MLCMISLALLAVGAYLLIFISFSLIGRRYLFTNLFIFISLALLAVGCLFAILISLALLAVDAYLLI